MNQFSAKSKFKTAEFIGNENKGVRFINKVRNNQKSTINKSVNVQNSLLPQKNLFIKNSNLKLRTNNNNSFNQIPKNSFRNNQNIPHKFSQGSLIKPHNELRNEGKKISSSYARNQLNDDFKKPFINKSITENKNEEKYSYRKNIKKTIHDNSNLKNDNNTRLYTNLNNQSTNIGVRDGTYNIQSKEIENSKSDNINNSENFIYNYSSPTKRKYETFENVNKNNENDNEEIKTSNKRFVQRNCNLDNNLNLECNKNFNNNSSSNNNNNNNYYYYNKNYNNLNNKTMNNSVDFFLGTNYMKSINNNFINNTNENLNSYSKYANDELFNNNSNNINNKFSDKNSFCDQDPNETVLNRSYPTVTVGKANDNFSSNALNRNYTNYERLKNNKVLLNGNNYELNHKHHYIEKNLNFNSENNKNKNHTEFIEHFNNHEKENIDQFSDLNTSMIKNTNTNLNYIPETNSEKITNNTSNKNNNNNNNFTCAFDRLSEENFNSYMKRKVDKNGDLIINMEEKSNIIKNNNNVNFSNNSRRCSNLLKNSAENNKMMNNIISNEHITLKNNIIDNNEMNLKNLSNSQSFSETNINNNMENYQDKYTYFKYSGISSISKGVNQNALRDTTNRKINLDTYKNNKEYLYFQNIIQNLTNCNHVESDIDALCKNVMNLNDYSLDFKYENECIDNILNLSNSVNNDIQNIRQIIYNKKKLVQDKRNIVNAEYENICQKLKDCESIFCDTNDETGEKRLKVFYEIDEKKNILKNKYETKKMLLKKSQYKIDKLQEYTDAIKLKTLAISKRYKKTFLLIEELFRLKIIKDKENEIEVCLIPKNTETDMWHRLQLDKNEITSDVCDYLWSQIESFVDKETFSNYF